MGRRALELAAEALRHAARTLDADFSKAVQELFLTKGKVIVTGVGKSAHIAAKIAATLNSTGTSAMFLHAGEAMHGDVGAVNHGDAVLCLSKSGSSDEVVALMPILKQRQCTIVAMTARPTSPLGQAADVLLNVDVSEEACPFDLAPTTSTSLQLAMGDALALALMNRSGFQPDDFAKNHPAGALGKKLTWTLGNSSTRAADQLWRGTLPSQKCCKPCLKRDTEPLWFGQRGVIAMWLALSPMVTFAGPWLRINSNLLGLEASPHCPQKTLSADTLASKAAHWMQDEKISQVVVMKGDTYAGMVHLHDCLREGLV